MFPKVKRVSVTSITSDTFTVGDLQDFLDQVPRPKGPNTRVAIGHDKRSGMYTLLVSEESE